MVLEGRGEEDLVDDSPDVRTAAVKSLSCYQVGLDRWMRTIFDFLEREADPGTRKASLSALIQVRPPMFSTQALPALVAGLSSRYREVQHCAALLIGLLGPNSAVAIPDLIRVMSHPIDPTKDPGGSHPAKWDPAGWLQRRSVRSPPGGPSAGTVVQALSEVLRAGHPYRRVAAAHALGQYGPAAVEAVCNYVRVPEGLRRSHIRRLG